MKKTIIILVIIAILIAGWVWSSYNKLVVANETVDGEWAQVDAQYQRRFDLIPNLVAAVKGIMTQEQQIFGDLAEARSKYAGAATTNEKAAAAGQVESAFGRLLAIMENYPELKSADTVQDLMAQLEGTENRITVARTRFNEVTRNFNMLIKQVPTNIIANMFGFDEKDYFQIEEGVEVAPEVNLDI